MRQGLEKKEDVQKRFCEHLAKLLQRLLIQKKYGARGTIEAKRCL